MDRERGWEVEIIYLQETITTISEWMVAASAGDIVLVCFPPMVLYYFRSKGEKHGSQQERQGEA